MEICHRGAWSCGDAEHSSGLCYSWLVSEWLLIGLRFVLCAFSPRSQKGRSHLHLTWSDTVTQSSLRRAQQCNASFLYYPRSASPFVWFPDCCLQWGALGFYGVKCSRGTTEQLWTTFPRCTCVANIGWFVCRHHKLSDKHLAQLRFSLRLRSFPELATVQIPSTVTSKWPKR